MGAGRLRPPFRLAQLVMEAFSIRVVHHEDVAEVAIGMRLPCRTYEMAEAKNHHSSFDKRRVTPCSENSASAMTTRYAGASRLRARSGISVRLRARPTPNDMDANWVCLILGPWQSGSSWRVWIAAMRSSS